MGGSEPMVSGAKLGQTIRLLALGLLSRAGRLRTAEAERDGWPACQCRLWDLSARPQASIDSFLSASIWRRVTRGVVRDLVAK